MSTDIVEHMVDIVLRDSSLHSVSFMNIDLVQLGRHLAGKLKDNTTLSNLMVWDRSFCIEGAEAVVKALQENHTLRSLTLMPWYKQHIPHHILSSISGERIQWFIFLECKKITCSYVYCYSLPKSQFSLINVLSENILL